MFMGPQSLPSSFSFFSIFDLFHTFSPIFFISYISFNIITIRIIIILHVTSISCSHVYAGPSGDQRFSFIKSISLVLTGRVCKNIGKYVKFWCCEVNIWDWSESTKHIGRDVEILMLQNLQVGLGGPQPI